MLHIKEEDDLSIITSKASCRTCSGECDGETKTSLMMKNEDVGRKKRSKAVLFLVLVVAVLCTGNVVYFVRGLLRQREVPLSYNLQQSHIRAVVYSWIAQKYGHLNLSTSDMPYPLLDPEAPTNKVISCYYNTPNNLEAPQLLPQDINSYLCTHINIAFARVVNKTIYLDENQKTVIPEVVKLKLKNPKLKILLSIGGAGNDNGFSDMVIDHASRKVFIKSIKNTLKNFTLDGVDLDWEFPAVHSRKVDRKKNRERQHFSQLLIEIRTEYIREKKDYFLTVAVAAPEIIVDTSYDVDQLNEYTDFVNIMTYDYHYYTKYTPFTGLNSPLYARNNEKLYLSTLNINYTVHMYMRKGLDRSKIVVGIPTYGHSFHLVNSDNTNIGSPATWYGSLGNVGFVEYPTICNFIEKFSADVTIKEDNFTKVPYLYRSHEWVSYDSPDSVMNKAKYIKDNNLRGAMIYSLNADDYQGVCDKGGTEKFPLSHSVKNTLIYENN